jgi:hypothetical protein
MLQGRAVEPDHDEGIGQFFAAPADLSRDNLEAPADERFENIEVAVQLGQRVSGDAIGGEPQPALLDHDRFLLAERSGSSVPAVGEELLARSAKLPIDLEEVIARHVDLAANLSHRVGRESSAGC